MEGPGNLRSHRGASFLVADFNGDRSAQPERNRPPGEKHAEPSAGILRLFDPRPVPTHFLKESHLFSKMVHPQEVFNSRNSGSEILRFTLPRTGLISFPRSKSPPKWLQGNNPVFRLRPRFVRPVAMALSNSGSCFSELRAIAIACESPAARSASTSAAAFAMMVAVLRRAMAMAGGRWPVAGV